MLLKWRIERLTAVPQICKSLDIFHRMRRLKSVRGESMGWIYSLLEACCDSVWRRETEGATALLLGLAGELTRRDVGVLYIYIAVTNIMLLRKLGESL